MRKSIALLLIALLAAAAGHAQANTQLTVQATGSSASPVRASASVSFRIVVPETVSFGEQPKPRPGNAPLVRTVSVEDGREVVTLARP